jgi:hypothetical protein
MNTFGLVSRGWIGPVFFIIEAIEIEASGFDSLHRAFVVPSFVLMETDDLFFRCNHVDLHAPSPGSPYAKGTAPIPQAGCSEWKITIHAAALF